MISIFSGAHLSGRGFSCGGGALMISSNKSITIGEMKKLYTVGYYFILGFFFL